MNKMKHTIKGKILIPFVIAILILIMSFLFGLNYLMQTEIDVVTNGKIKSVSNKFELQKTKDVESMHAIIIALQQDKELQKYWLDRDRDKLLEKSLRTYIELQKIVDITHFYFHDTSAVNFLRVHHPEKYGDLIDRYTMRDAKNLLTISSGIEIGPLGTFTLRVVVPWFIDGKLEGFIELGEEIEHITEQISTMMDIDLFVFYKKQFITKEKYVNGMEILKREQDWDKFNNWVLIYQTISWIPEIFKEFSPDNFSKLSLEEKEIHYNNTDYVVRSISISDAGQREVAIMLVLIDCTLEFEITRNLSYMISVIAFGIGIFLFVLFNIVLSRIEKKLNESQNRVLTEVKKREAIQEAHVNELVKEKEKLIESENRFHTVVTHSSPIIFMIDKEGIIQLSEGKMLANLGLKPGELVGQTIFELYLDNPDLLSIFKKTLNDEIFEGVLEVGGRFFESFYTPNKDSAGNIIGVIGMALDITERKQADDKLQKQTEDLKNSNQELQKSHMAALSIMQDANLQKSITDKALSDLEKSTLESKKLSKAIEQASATVVITDTEGIIEYVNPHFTTVTGYQAAEVLGENPRILQSGNLPKELYAEMWKIITSGKIWKGEFENKKKNGELYWESVSISPVINKTGKTTHFVAVKEDITKKKKTDQELREAKIVAEVATEAKSRFLASMSHEIRTPMNAIIGFSHLALNTELNPKQLEYLSKIDLSAKVLLGIINDILDFSKIEANELTIENIDFNLEDVIASVTNLISQKVFEKGLELIIHISPNVPLSLIGDPLRIGQILTNFCNNAVKFTEKGEVIIDVTLIAGDEKKAELLFAVKDTGIGIKKGQKDKLFKAFQQADTSTTREFGGTGLGLVITENLAKLMQGNIWFESKEKQGSTFFFSVKLEKQKTQCVNKQLFAKELTEMKVLLLDNNPTSNRFLIEALESFLVKVKSVSSEEEALTILAEFGNQSPYKLVIADFREIEIENLANFEFIKTNYNMQVIMIVSPFQLEKVAKTEATKIFDSFLLKPYNYSDLFNGIMELFGKVGIRDVMTFSNKPQNFESLKRIKDSLILLVEDNEINQELIVEMFATKELRVEIAENGLEAVEKVHNSGFPSKYSLVLMDIQMPIMDGFTATRKIRELENYKALPIIAMTADAMVDMKENCMKAGMVDYLPKPIEPEKVFEALVKWIKPKKNLTINKNNKSEACFEKKKEKMVMPEIAGINVAEGLRYVGGDKDLFMSLLEKFLDNANFKDKIKKALQKSDREETVRLIHTLKGNAGLLGMYELKDTTNRAQNALLKDKNLGVEIFLTEILEKLIPILNSLKLLFDNEKGEVRLGVKFLEEVEDKLSELKTLLESHDLDAISLISNIGSIIGFESEMIELEKTINNYQFEKALGLLRSIIKF